MERYDGALHMADLGQVKTKMNTPMKNTSTAEHYTWGGGCNGWHLVKNEVLSVIQERMPPHTSEVRHKHRVSQQFFFVLAGEAMLEADGVVHQLRANEGLEIPAMIPHQMMNQTESDLEFIVISTPPSHGDRIAV
jgi:mannose-6-phosphate isomerase-like protein (cupin superfamily)